MYGVSQHSLILPQKLMCLYLLAFMWYILISHQSRYSGRSIFAQLRKIGLCDYFPQIIVELAPHFSSLEWLVNDHIIITYNIYGYGFFCLMYFFFFVLLEGQSCKRFSLSFFTECFLYFTFFYTILVNLSSMIFLNYGVSLTSVLLIVCLIVNV